MKKLRVLWLQNMVVPQIAEKLEIGKGYGGGWLTSLFDSFSKNREIELAIVASIPSKKNLINGKIICNATFYSFCEKNIEKYDKSLEIRFKEIVEEFQPDIVHIFGTEYPHTLAMVRAFGKPERTVIHIQGLVSVIARHYDSFLPYDVQRAYTFRDFIKQDNIREQKKKFEIRGTFECEAIRNVLHVMGRTDWDRACAEIIHPGIYYHEGQEMLRSNFYEGSWDIQKCEKYSIFMSQGSYPIKGLHIALEALNLLKTKHPDIKLYVAGSDIIHYDDLKQKIKKTYYAKYIEDLIKKWNLENQVIFLGSLNTEEMKERYLSSHVFISPSVIENSPNSIGEAMLLGVPIVASAVGGVSSLIKHEENGFLYQADAPYMLAYYVEKILEQKKLAVEVSKVERRYAERTYNQEMVIKQVVSAYNEILQKF